MKFCQNCGSQLEDGVTFCQNCGTKIDADDSKQNPAPVNFQTVQTPQPQPPPLPQPPPQPQIQQSNSSSKKILYIIPLVIFGAIFIGGGIFFYNCKQNNQDPVKVFKAILSGEDDDFYLRRGKEYYNKQEYNYAIEEYQKALEINPNNAKTFIFKWGLLMTIYKIITMRLLPSKNLPKFFLNMTKHITILAFHIKI